LVVCQRFNVEHIVDLLLDGHIDALKPTIREWTRLHGGYLEERCESAGFVRLEDCPVERDFCPASLRVRRTTIVVASASDHCPYSTPLDHFY
jgi:hypothetical protein